MINYASKGLIPPRPQRRSLLRVMFEVLMLLTWAVAGVLLVAVLSGIVAALYGYRMFLWIAPVAVLFILLVWAGAMRRVRRRRARTVLGYLENAVRLNLPLLPMLDAARQSESPPVARQLARLADLLGAGASLETALEYSVPQLPARQRLLIAAAERSGIVAKTLRRIVHADDDHPGAAGAALVDPTTTTFYRIYPVIMLLAGSGVIAMLAVFVMPKFEQIFKDFGVRMPGLTIVVMQMTATVAIPVLAVTGLFLLILLARAMSDIFLPPRFQFDPARPLVGPLAWWLPVSHGIVRDRGLADVTQLLADLLGAGMSLDAALGQAAQLRVNPVLKRRLLRWRNGITQGQSIDQAARAARLPRLLVGMLASGSGRTDLPAVFRFLARYYQTRFSRTQILLEGAAIPAVVFLLAAIVTAISLSMFLPIVNLMDATGISTGYM